MNTSVFWVPEPWRGRLGIVPISAAMLSALLVIPAVPAQAGQTDPDPSALVQQLGQFRAAMDPRIQSHTGELLPAEQQRQAVFRRLRALGASAVPALRRGLTDPDVQVRRNVALYLDFEAGNYARATQGPLDLTPFLTPLIVALRDDDARVKELAAQAVGHIGAEAAVAVPHLLRLLADPGEGLRNSACIGLAGIGPAASDALPALRRALSDPSVDVRRFAQRAIDMITKKEAG